PTGKTGDRYMYLGVNMGQAGADATPTSLAYSRVYSDSVGTFQADTTYRLTVALYVPNDYFSNLIDVGLGLSTGATANSIIDMDWYGRASTRRGDPNNMGD